MDLNEFVNTALLQIVQGVKGAQEAVAKLGGAVSPAMSSHNKESSAYFGTVDESQYVFLVDFDVAVSVSEAGGKKAGGKLQVASIFGINGEAQASHSSAATNRLSFKVPLALPVDARTAGHLSESQRESRARLGSLGS